MCMLVGIRERSCQSKALSDPGFNCGKSADAEERRGFRQFCLISPHQEASVCDADDVYFRKGRSESLDSSYNRMNGLVVFLSKESSKFGEFQ